MARKSEDAGSALDRMYAELSRLVDRWEPMAKDNPWRLREIWNEAFETLRADSRNMSPEEIEEDRREIERLDRGEVSEKEFRSRYGRNNVFWRERLLMEELDALHSLGPGTCTEYVQWSEWKSEQHRMEWTGKSTTAT